MFGSRVLDTAIGLALVLLLMSILSSTLREALEGWLRSRPRYLLRGILELLDPNDPALTAELYSHPLISGLYRGTFAEGTDATGRDAPVGSKLPSYIPPELFARALLDLTMRGRGPGALSTTAPMTADAIRGGVASLHNPTVARIVLLALDAGSNTVDGCVGELAKWYDRAMERVTGWYRRESQVVLFSIGFFTAIGLNVSFLRIAEALYNNESLRSVAVAEATRLTDATTAADLAAMTTPPPPAAAPMAAQAAGTSARGATTPPATTSPDPARRVELRKRLAESRARLDSLGLPIGWSDADVQVPIASNAGVLRFIGWLLTGVLVSFGAPFWFDVLSKFVSIRTTVKPPARATAADDTKGAERGSAAQRATTPAAGGATIADPIGHSGQPAGAPLAVGTAPPIVTLAPFASNEWAHGADPHEGVI
jgi:hypothetical protein